MILHVLKRSDWDDAQSAGVYSPRSLQTEGFIHCSTVEQLLATANSFFRGLDDLLLLCIDETRLEARLEYEPPAAPDDQRAALRFPHLYGPLNLDAVARVIAFPCEADGNFRLPAELAVR